MTAYLSHGRLILIFHWMHYGCNMVLSPTRCVTTAAQSQLSSNDMVRSRHNSQSMRGRDISQQTECIKAHIYATCTGSFPFRVLIKVVLIATCCVIAMLFRRLRHKDWDAALFPQCDRQVCDQRHHGFPTLLQVMFLCLMLPTIGGLRNELSFRDK